MKFAELLRTAATALRSSPATVCSNAVTPREANLLIGRRLFSWTDLLGRLETTLPDDVRITSMRPDIDRNGEITVQMTVVGRRVEDIDRFMTVSVTFNPAALRVRQIQEGSFLRQGGVTVTFNNKTDANIGRVDLTFTRVGDVVGASGSGLLASIMFDAVGTGTSQMNVNGTATDPRGSTIPVQFMPISIVVR